MLLKGDGTDAACGNNERGCCSIPELRDLTYTQVAAGAFHAVLLRSDGTAVAGGIMIKDNVTSQSLEI